MVLWAIARVWEIRVKKDKIKYEKKFLILPSLFISFFLWQLISLTYTNNCRNGLNIIFSRLSLIIVPLLFISRGQKIIRDSGLLLKLFALSTTFNVIFCFLLALVKSLYIQNGDLLFNPHPPEEYWMNYFYGYYLSGVLHPSYLAIFVSLSVFIALESYLDNNMSRNKKIFWACTGLILLTSIYFLSSKAGFLAIICSLPIYFVIRFKYRNKLILTTLSICLLVFAIYSIIKTNERIEIVLEQVNSGSFSKKIAQDSRILIWKSSINVIKKNPVFGVGVGDVRDQLIDYSAIN